MCRQLQTAPASAAAGASCRKTPSVPRPSCTEIRKETGRSQAAVRLRQVIRHTKHGSLRAPKTKLLTVTQPGSPTGLLGRSLRRAAQLGGKVRTSIWLSEAARGSLPPPLPPSLPPPGVPVLIPAPPAHGSQRGAARCASFPARDWFHLCK